MNSKVDDAIVCQVRALKCGLGGAGSNQESIAPIVDCTLRCQHLFSGSRQVGKGVQLVTTSSTYLFQFIWVVRNSADCQECVEELVWASRLCRQEGVCGRRWCVYDGVGFNNIMASCIYQSIERYEMKLTVADHDQVLLLLSFRNRREQHVVQLAAFIPPRLLRLDGFKIRATCISI